MSVSPWLSSTERGLNAQSDMAGDVINYTYTVTSSGTTSVEGPVVVGSTETSIDFTTMKKDLNQFWTDTLQAKVLSNDLASMPDHLYGFKYFSEQGLSGTSDPIWGSGNGNVVVGQVPGSFTMVHELNHILDRTAEGTWGKHVRDPDGSNDDWGCTASGPDANWPYTGNDEIQETGFDTTLPGQILNMAGGLTIVPASRPEFMSYCKERPRPDRWISPYRWHAIFNVYLPPQPALLSALATIEDVFYISGQINLDDTGKLNPIQLLPGVVGTAMVPGEYSIEFRDIGDGLLYSMPFMASFTGVEDESLEAVYFFFQLPFRENVARVLLKHNDTVLDSIEPSLNAPTLEVTAPGDGDIWSGQETIRWIADDLDGDPLQFSILYSPDAGSYWYPIASQLTGSEFTVDVGSLVGGADGRILVVASDGFHTVSAESAGAFTVPNPVPTVVIDSPPDGSVITPRDRIKLSGSASLPSGSGDDLSFIGSVNGEMVGAGAMANTLLEEGIHTITLAVYDDEGNFGEASVTINVVMNDPPNKPINPFPGDGVTGVFVKAIPSWLGGDLDGDTVTYDVYLEAGNSAPVVLVCDDTPLTDCVPPADLLLSTQYYWQVVAKDSQGETTFGDIWTFSTGDHDPEQVIHVDSFE